MSRNQIDRKEIHTAILLFLIATVRSLSLHEKKVDVTNDLSTLNVVHYSKDRPLQRNHDYKATNNSI